MKKTHILVISDIHLGSENCNAKKLLELLKEFSYEILIILGDLHEREGIISDEQFEVIEYLRQHKKEIICIDGNHDPAEENWVRSIIGVDPVKEYKMTINEIKFIFLHGHKFDNVWFVFNEPLIDRIFYKFIWVLKLINFWGFNFVNWLNSFHNDFSRHFKKRAKKYAKKHKGTLVCGHTHYPEEDGNYLNCGGWVGDLHTYITIDKKGNAKLHSTTL